MSKEIAARNDCRELKESNIIEELGGLFGEVTRKMSPECLAIVRGKYNPKKWFNPKAEKTLVY